MKKNINRRSILLSIFFLFVSSLLQFFRGFNFLIPRAKARTQFLRPPGSGEESKFLSKCIRCRACANVCEAGCIRFFTLSDGLELAGTPYLLPRIKACNLCTNCTQICPTGALQPIEENLEDIKSKVRMGTARVVEDHCLSFNGRICGVCHDACPLKGEAIQLMTRARPKVFEDVCIGCGRCEERCPQSPGAIIVEPLKDKV